MSGSGQQNHGAAQSPSEYAKSTGLQSLLNKAVNDCYLAQSPCPAATMSQLLQSTYTLDTFSDISISEVFDGEGSGGGFTAEVAVQLAGGQRITTMVSHSNSTVPFHPNSNTTGRKIALIPYEVLAATGPGSLQSVLCPPPSSPPQVVSKKGSDKTPAGDGGAAGGGAASSTNASSNSAGVAGVSAQGSGGVGDVDPTGLITAAALTKATRFRLGSSIEFYNKRVKTSLMQLRAVAQQQIDDALFNADSPTNASTPTAGVAGVPFSNLLGQVAAAVSLACAKSAAAALNKPLAIYIGGLYKGICDREDPYAVAAQLSSGGVGNSNYRTDNNNNGGNKASGSSSPPHSLNSTVTMRSGTPMFDEEISTANNNNNANSNINKQPLAVINPSFYSIPDLIVTVFSTDPRGMGKVRVREVCLVVKVQSAQAEALYSATNQNNNTKKNNNNNKKYGVESSMILNGSTSYGSGVGAGGVPKQNYAATLAGRSSELSPMGAAALRASQSGILGMDTVAAMHAIIDLATSKAAAIAAAQCGASAAEMEASMMPTMPDGSVRFPFWESVEQIVSTMEASIREVAGAQGNNAFDNSNNNTVNGVFSVFSVGLVLDGGLCYRPQLDKYALVNGEPEMTGAMLSELLAAIVGGAAATSTAQQQASTGAGTSNQQSQNAAGLSPGTMSLNPSSPPPSDLVVMPSGVVTYLEDTHASSDLLAMQRLMYRVGSAPPPRSVVVAGNHLYGTDATALSQGARLKLTNNATLRMNDVGRLWTLLERARFYRNCFPGASVGLTGEVSEGDGAALAHIAIGIHAKTLRVGGMLRREHAAIVNEMVRMSEYLSKAGLLAKQPPQYDNSRMARPPRPAEIVAEVVAAPVKKGARK